MRNILAKVPFGCLVRSVEEIGWKVQGTFPAHRRCHVHVTPSGHSPSRQLGKISDRRWSEPSPAS
jgi:hypothetical protein